MPGIFLYALKKHGKGNQDKEGDQGVSALSVGLAGTGVDREGREPPPLLTTLSRSGEIYAYNARTGDPLAKGEGPWGGCEGCSEAGSTGDLRNTKREEPGVSRRVTSISMEGGRLITNGGKNPQELPRGTGIPGIWMLSGTMLECKRSGVMVPIPVWTDSDDTTREKLSEKEEERPDEEDIDEWHAQEQVYCPPSPSRELSRAGSSLGTPRSMASPVPHYSPFRSPRRSKTPLSILSLTEEAADVDGFELGDMTAATATEDGAPTETEEKDDGSLSIGETPIQTPTLMAKTVIPLQGKVSTPSSLILILMTLMTLCLSTAGAQALNPRRRRIQSISEPVWENRPGLGLTSRTPLGPRNGC